MRRTLLVLACTIALAGCGNQAPAAKDSPKAPATKTPEQLAAALPTNAQFHGLKIGEECRTFGGDCETPTPSDTVFVSSKIEDAIESVLVRKAAGEKA